MRPIAKIRRRIQNWLGITGLRRALLEQSRLLAEIAGDVDNHNSAIGCLDDIDSAIDDAVERLENDLAIDGCGIEEIVSDLQGRVTDLESEVEDLSNAMGADAD